MTHALAARSLFALLLVLSPAVAQDVPVVGYHLATGTGWSTITNPTASAITSSSIVVTQAGSPWLKLWFGAADLGTASAIRVTGVQDQAVQVLDGAALSAWSGTSAYFNGDTVIVELVVAPHDSASAFIAGFDTGFESPSMPDTVCGIDNRVPSTERKVGRLLNSTLNAICSGGIVSTNSCYLTAGHCVAGGTVFSVEFNCPPSTLGGTIVHPGPQDQYPVDSTTMASLNGGIGMDYALARLSNNTTTGLPAALVQGYYNLAPTLPPVGSLTRITGFGTANGIFNQANQTSTGSLTIVSGTTVQYTVDTTGGSSGSSVVLESNQKVYGIHTNGGCTATGGSNSGTAITFSGVQTHYAAVCNAGQPLYAISLTQGGAGTPIVVSVVHAPPSSELYNLVSLTPAIPTNSGPTVGLVIGASDVLALVGLPLGAEPFHVLANASGSYTFSAPTGLPGIPLNVDIVSVAFTPGAGFAGYLGRSPAVNATVLL